MSSLSCRSDRLKKHRHQPKHKECDKRQCSHSKRYDPCDSRRPELISVILPHLLKPDCLL
jgi:hypothetical protein